jgi:hypothetical protein
MKHLKDKTKFILFVISLNVLFFSSCNYRSDNNQSGESQELNNDNTQKDKSSDFFFKLYLERSESMVPYDNVSGAGDFKEVIVNLLNRLDMINPGNNIIYIVNDSIYLFKRKFAQFIQAGNVFEITKNYGDPSWTDFNLIFETVLKDTKANQLSILVSDLIYSPKNFTNKSGKKIALEVQQLSQNIFNRYKSDFSLLVIKYTGDFNGPYYAFDNTTFNYHNNRPYYLMLIAKNNVLAQVLTNNKYQSFREFTKMKGFQNYYLFNCHNESSPPYYSLLPFSNLNIAKFNVKRSEKNSSSRIIELEKIDFDPRQNKFELVVALDLNQYFIAEDYKTNVNNYNIEPNNFFDVVKIEPINKSLINPNDIKYLGTSTHLMTICAKNFDNFQNEIHISLKRIYPKWFKESSTVDDRNPNYPYFSKQTFAFSELMTGIFDSYFPVTAESNYFTIELFLNF